MCNCSMYKLQHLGIARYFAFHCRVTTKDALFLNGSGTGSQGAHNSSVRVESPNLSESPGLYPRAEYSVDGCLCSQCSSNFPQVS